MVAAGGGGGKASIPGGGVTGQTGTDAYSSNQKASGATLIEGGAGYYDMIGSHT
jgi:hypothetical protein